MTDPYYNRLIFFANKFRPQAFVISRLRPRTPKLLLGTKGATSMKKQRKKSTAKRNSPQAEPAAKVNRRGALRFMRNAAIALPVVGVAGYFGVQKVQASICEIDLSKVGDGLPAVVQIHDPQCNLCVTLQRQTRRALRAYDDDSHHFLVANIATTEGQFFAQRHGVGNVTLVLLDGAGAQVGVVRGPLSNEALRDAIEAHLGPTT